MAEVEEDAAASIRMKSLTRDEVDEDRLPLLPRDSPPLCLPLDLVESGDGGKDFFLVFFLMLSNCLSVLGPTTAGLVPCCSTYRAGMVTNKTSVYFFTILLVLDQA